MRISLEDAASVAGDYDNIIWVHTQYTPKEEGIEMICKSLGVDKSKITVPRHLQSTIYYQLNKFLKNSTKNYKAPKENHCWCVWQETHH